MPLYFFDTIAGSGLIRDDIGIVLSDDAVARRYGLEALPEMARSEVPGSTLPGSDRQTFSVFVRDAERQMIYVAELHLVGGWMPKRSPAECVQD